MSYSEACVRAEREEDDPLPYPEAFVVPPTRYDQREWPGVR